MTNDKPNRLQKYQEHWSTSDPRRRTRAYLFKVLYEGGLSFVAAAVFVYLAVVGAELVFSIQMPLSQSIAGFFVVFAAFVAMTFCKLITDVRDREEYTVQSELPTSESEDDESAQR